MRIGTLATAAGLGLRTGLLAGAHADTVKIGFFAFLANGCAPWSW
jgi:hypothetical protein